jgi:hypothetical protein
MKHTLILFAAFLCSHCIPSNALAEIYSCKGPTGKVIFTDNKSSCTSGLSKVSIKTTKDKRANYRYPARHYIEKKSHYSIFVESPESEKDELQLEAANKRLSDTLDYIYEKIPESSHGYLMSIGFYIMIGPRSKLGGEDNGLRYYTRNGDSKLLLGDKRWAHSVVIFSVENFLALSDLWAKKAVMHELSHAWHYKNWNDNYPVLKDAWLSARHRGLYLSQEDVDGKILQPAYASTNEKEYFAELSAIYFVGGNYYPLQREELKAYDPVGFSMVEHVWGL